MSDDKRKMYQKKETGTVPKAKYRIKNESRLQYQNVPTKNSVRDPDQSKLYTNSDLQKKNILRTHYCMMDHPPEEQNAAIKQNSMLSISANGSVSSTSQSTSTSESRRNSAGTICSKSDNVAKYPDKKQIEDKLNQIREYIQVTSSLMANIKNTDDQFNSDEVASLAELVDSLKDSEGKLMATLRALECYEEEQRNFDQKELSEMSGEQEVEHQRQNDMEKRVLLANREIEKLQQDNVLLNLQIKAENQMRNAVKVQQKLAQQHHQSSKELNHIKSAKFEDEQFLNESQASFCGSTQPGSNLQENLVNQIDSLHQKIGYFHDANEQSTQLLQMLDNRDAQLQNEHVNLQVKLKDLQEKKLQVDSLVSQLENMNEESEEDDVRVQVQKIVTMKKQLEKLKGILEVVKNTETLIETQQQNFNESDGEQQQESSCNKTDNLRCSKNRDVAKGGGTSSSSNNIVAREPKMNEKQINKSKLNANERERIKLQSELQAKKRELEELMFKHKAVTSNLNQDFHCDSKSDHGLLENESNTWYPAPNVYNLLPTSEYSSDECPDDELSQVNSLDNNKTSHQIPQMPSLNYLTSNYIKRELDPRSGDTATEYSQTSSNKRAPSGRNGLPNLPPTYAREPSCQNNNGEQLDKYQIQKQLELIRSVCDTMLDEHSANSQVRNNLTPSSIYTEPRQYESLGGSQSGNVLNALANHGEPLAFPMGHHQSAPSNEVNYQNWLATNTLQTQAFMLNTLNQCCQMLWLQQREIASLRNTVNMINERLPGVQQQCDQSGLGSFIGVDSSVLRPAPVQARPLVPAPGPTHPPKANQSQPSHHVSSATSMPNLNQMHVPHHQPAVTNLDANNPHVAPRLIDASALTLNNGHAFMNNGGPANHPIWNGQVALNNQVPPGNRANNYWDNFRSYSRQNLLSTKSNEGLQNLCSVVDSRSGSNSSYTYQQQQMPPSAPTMPITKTNVEINEAPVSSSATMASNRCSRQRTVFKIPQLVPTANVPPPDVLNVNQTLKCNHEHGPEIAEDVLVPILNYHPTEHEVSSATGLVYDNSNVHQADHLKNWRSSLNRQVANRNEWHEDSQENSTIKSKLFEALRENVYKEVASLISANQGRPHFLIQLFRDLQLISSDPLRRQTLQSIQSLITQSICAETAQIFDQSTLPSSQLDQQSADDGSSISKPIQTIPAPFPAFPGATDGTDHPHLPEYLKAALNFLNKHAEDKLHNDLLEAFKKLLVDTTFSIVFSNIKDDAIQKHFLALISETIEQFRNSPIKDVKSLILHAIEEIYRGEITFLRLMRENLMGACMENDVSTSFDVASPKMYETPQQMQNADLAEADQSRIDDEDAEEEEGDEDSNEGAVGGLLIDRTNSNALNQINCDESSDLVKIEFPIDAEADSEFTEGLDQVPTRLTQSLKLSSDSVNRDHSSAPKSDM